MGNLIQQSWDLLITAPDDQLEPKLRTELITFGPDITPVQIAIVLQKCVRYGAASSLVVNLFDMFLRDAVDQSEEAYRVALNEAIEQILEKEN